MRILHLAPEPGSSNGIAAYAANYREALALAGVEAVRLESARGAGHSMTDVLRYTAAAEREAQTGYDIVHAELGGRALREFYALRQIQRQGAICTFATLHDPPGVVWWPFHFDMVRQSRPVASAVRRLSAGAAARLEARVVGNLDGVLTLTRAGTEAVDAAFGSAAGTRALALPYPLRSGLMEPGPLPRPDGRSEPGPFAIGFFGYWYEGKGLLGLVEALARLRRDGVDFRARLWGDVSRDAGLRPARRYRRRVLEAITQSQLDDVVEVLGFLEPGAVTQGLGECDVVVLPYETSGVTEPLRSTSAVMFDAFAAGTPVIASDVKALREEIRHGENGLLVPPADPVALAEALRRLSADAVLLERLRQGARRRAETLDLLACAETAIGEYRRVTAARPAAMPSPARR